MNIAEWIDKNGLVKPQSHWQDSGNGVLYSAILLILSAFKIKFEGWNSIETAMQKCLRGGLLFRSPDNVYQEQWDNHLGLAAYSFFSGDTKTARAVIWYGITHFGFFDTDGVLEFKDNLFRFPQIWVLYTIAAFPKFKWIFYPWAWIVSLFMKPDRIDASGTQLAWLYLYTVRNVYGVGFEKKYTDVLLQFHENVGEYYGAGHPTVELVNGLTA